ncbi:ATP cone domain-containing protein [Methanobacterium alcaliphilum]|uniref:ATP cone domain-containing protein n=1 Tax=Methanobacterium alcaliphilum TaxID=392018 RepID=UPI00200A1CDB|nr:ATP cone domain-containing protein [Methanobacterium alcaliphilum]MCK9151862.1 ATP cone domain-containing protein [Methanobacterium alcaliphilum]
MVKIVKKKGISEPFKPNKILKSLQKATIDAGYNLEEKKEIINTVCSKISSKLDEKKEMDTATIRGCLLTELDKCEPYIAKSWRRFDKKYKSR